MTCIIIHASYLRQYMRRKNIGSFLLTYSACGNRNVAISASDSCILLQLPYFVANSLNCRGVYADRLSVRSHMQFQFDDLNVTALSQGQGLIRIIIRLVQRYNSIGYEQIMTYIRKTTTLSQRLSKELFCFATCINDNLSKSKMKRTAQSINSI